ncbi:uncharacterized protein FRV6_00966 [Fusarium oxysporum]|uniref:Endo-chitosanase n=1 Tax=Fusarium oxysporum TaxID=5507 RepID=A0A2H3SWC9_FUSOX|nr:uncharacterized protein FRV6_00966 [Fusarium oxysporum]
MQLDRIYGMFGVLRGLGIELPAADYEESLVKVVFQVLCQISRQYRSIQILQFVTGEHSLNGLPSWIPDYCIVPWSTVQYGHEVGSVEFEPNGTVLSVRGKRLDSIAAVSSTISHLDLHSGVVTEAFDLSISTFQAKIRDWLEFITTAHTNQACCQIDIIRRIFQLFIHPQVEACYNEAGAIPWAYFSSDRLHLHFAHWLADVLDNSQKTPSSHGWDNSFDQVPHFLSSEAVITSHGPESPHNFDNPFHLNLSDVGYPRAISVLQRWVREYVAQKKVFRTDANLHSYVVFGTKDLNPQGHGIEPLSVMAVVCRNQVFYGVWGDTNGFRSTGESSLALARLCFPNEGLNGNKSHGKKGVLFIGFTGKGAVPGANGANWKAKNRRQFQDSLKGLGDKLVAGLKI